MLSFWDEAQYHEFGKKYRNQYTIIHALNNPTNDRFHVWVQKTVVRKVMGKGRIWREVRGVHGKAQTE